MVKQPKIIEQQITFYLSHTYKSSKKYHYPIFAIIINSYVVNDMFGLGPRWPRP